MILTHENEVYSWGADTAGQLGFRGFDSLNTPHKIPGYISSEPKQGARTYFSKWKELKQIFCGTAHSIVLTYDHKIYIWGHNTFGELGFGDNTHHRRTAQILNFLAQPEKIKQIACRGNHTMLLTYSNEVYVWGANSWGELGLGDYKDRHSTTKLIFFDECKKIKQIFFKNRCMR
jgi:alpha-tubulin suppressor-like RCC1 family protein